MRASLFHICPQDLQGLLLHPLSELERLFPEIATRAKRKYVGREWLPEAVVPPLGCRWMDVVMFTPVHPKQMADALIAAGHSRFPRRWIEMDAEQREAYARDVPGETLLFDQTLHVLHRGSVSFDAARIMTL